MQKHAAGIAVKGFSTSCEYTWYISGTTIRQIALLQSKKLEQNATEAWGK